MMGKFLLGDVKVVVNGVDLSGHAFNVDTPSVKDQVDVSGFSPVGAREFLPGQEDQTITISFENDFATGSVHATLNPLYVSGSAFPIYLQPVSAGGTSPTNPIFAGSACLYDYNGLSGALQQRAENIATFKPASGSRFTWGTVTP
jgi:hypothetical protein